MPDHIFDLSGRVAVVTGGNGGIGLGIARGLAQSGADIVVAARNQNKTASAVKELQRSFKGSASGRWGSPPTSQTRRRVG